VPIKLVKLNILFIVVLCLVSGRVLAGCTVSNGSVNLGTYGSFNLFNTPATANNLVGLNCTGLLGLGVLSGDQIIVTLTNSSNNLNLANTNNSTDKIPYIVYADSAYQYPFALNQPVNYANIGLLSIVLGGKSFTTRLYFRTTSGANISARNYSDTLTFNWNYNICTGIGLTSLICLGRETGNKNSTVTVTLIVTKQCAINNTPDTNFGSYSFVGQFSPITQSITLNCTKTEGYKVSLGDGNNKTGNWRRMTDNQGNYLQYNLYQSDGTTLWDINNKYTGTGTGTSQNIPYKAIINPTQTEQPSGNYTDQIIVTLEY